MNRKTLWNTIYFLTFFINAHAQQAYTPIGARAAGMGNITATTVDAWSAVNNPAGLGVLETSVVGISHEQRFSMAEMSVSSIVGTFRLLGNGVGITFSNTGFFDFGENFLGLSAGRKLNEFISVGVGINCNMLRFSPEYRNLYAIAGQAGVWARPSKNLTLGFCVNNLTFSTWSDENSSPLPVVFSLGAAYSVAASVQLYAEASKDIRESLRLKIGTEFLTAQVLYLRAGVISEPFEPHFGVGYAYKKWKFDAAVNYHPFLGYTPQGGMSFEF